MKRPLAITWFGRLYLSSAILSFIFTLVYYPQLRAWTLERGSAPGAILGVSLLGLLATFAFWYFIAKRASTIAKWVLVVATAVGLASYIAGYQAYLEFGVAYFIIDAMLRLLTLTACAFLFRADAAEWFRNRGRNAPDATVFD